MKKKAFTLAEVLLTLAVIGIVAAITLPSLLVDTTEKAFDAQKRALHARLAQAIGMMSSLSGYGQYTEETKEGAGDGKDDAAETFLYEGLSKVYKMNNICDSDNLDKCGIPGSITIMTGKTLDFPKKISELNSDLTIKADTKAAAFETVNGESIAVFYNPNCTNNNETNGTSSNFPEGTEFEDETYEAFPMQDTICVNFVYDLNGVKGPNKVGRDIGFIAAVGAKNSEVVAPIPFESDVDSAAHPQTEAIELCANYSDDSRLPNKDEAGALFFNKKLIGNFSYNVSYWTSSVISKTRAWSQHMYKSGTRTKNLRNYPEGVRCIRK